MRSTLHDIFFGGNREHGQSIVEIGLITPLLLVALYIPADFGVAFLIGNLVQNAAREGARIGAGLQKTGGSSPNYNYTTTEATRVKDAVFSHMPQTQRLTNKSVTVTFYEGTTPTCLEYVQVRAQGDYNFFFYQILRLFGSTVPSSRTISRTTQMQYIFQPYSNTTACTTTTVNQSYTS
jgi:Flp pilus assembly protein TadG